MTKRYKIFWVILSILSILLNVGPVVVYIIMALAGGALIVEKVTLCMTVFIVLILSIVAWVNKTTMRSRLWVVIIGLYFILDYFVAPLMIVGCCQIVDEWFVCPLKAHCRDVYTINKQMDKRGV